jgi:hypothetical protein
MAQVVEYLLSKLEALNSNPKSVLPNKNKKMNKKPFHLYTLTRN